jgi:hypothetical protein
MLITLGITHAQSVKEVILSDSGEKTEEEVRESLQCLSHSKWNLFFEHSMPDLGIQYLRDQLAKGVTQNKRYYIQVDNTHNVMYFKEGNNFFLHLNEIKDDGSEHLLMRAFLQDDFNNCIRLLPESCKWKGERVVKYIEVCEQGLVQSGDFTHDFFKVVLDQEEGTFSPLEIARAIRDCYQPKVYSIAYKCYVDGLYFNPQDAVKYLKDVQKKMEDYGFETSLDLENMEINYSKVAVEVNGMEVRLE